MKRIRNVTIISSTLIAVLLPYTLYVQVNRWRMDDARTPRGRYTAQQVISRACRLNEEVSADADEYTAVAQFNDAPRPGRPSVHLWSVLCSSGSRTCDKYFVWNADTGKLITVSYRHAACANMGDCYGSKEAVDCASAWLMRLGMADSRHPLRLTEPPRKMPASWEVAFAVGSQRASVQFSAGDGSLLYAHMW
jgi:hypothetical protein